MRTRRIYGLDACSVYHCVTRTVNGEMLFGDKEKEVMRRMLWQVADFSGVEVLTYAVMSNHVHVLVRVSKQAREVSDAELLRRFRVLYPKPTKHRTEDLEVVAQMLRDNTEDGQKLREQLQARMGDVSEFMKTLKQRYSIWFNKNQGRYGPLWCDRFKSTVVEGGGPGMASGAALRTVAAYIDLNPVRAGLVEDPKDYRFCGYAEAVGGSKVARAGIRAVMGLSEDKAALAGYRMCLYGKGAAPKRGGSGARLSEAAFQEVMAAAGELPDRELLMQQIKRFTQGAVIGSALFVERHIEQWSSKIGDRRQRKPQSLPAQNDGGLSTFRRTRSESFSGPL